MVLTEGTYHQNTAKMEYYFPIKLPVYRKGKWKDFLFTRRKLHIKNL
jgi:hypothetical protein